MWLSFSLTAFFDKSFRAGGCADSNYPFLTLKERDIETGLDYFNARYYSSVQGRFTSVDPYNIVREAQITAQSNPDEARSQLQRYLRSPQQWNRYAYVAGNPLKYIDPTGEYLELTGNEQEQEAAWKRIQDLVGKEGANYIQKVQMCVNGHCGTYVEYKPQSPGNEMQAGFAASNKLNAFLGQIIDSNNTTEYRIATHFDTKFEKGIALTSMRCGGGCTVGSDESINGNTQIFVHPDSGNVAQMAFNVFTNTGKFKGAAQLDFYDDIVDAHEFGHAYANAIEGKPTHKSNETFQRSLDFENLQRGTYPMKGRRTGH